MKALRFIGLAAFLFIASLMSFQSQPRAQSGWYSIKTPFAITDFDALNDSVIAGYQRSGATQVSFDGGRTWILHSTAPREPLDSFSQYQIKLIGPTDIRIIGALDESFRSSVYFTYYTGESYDSGSTWTSHKGGSGSEFGYRLIRHSTQRWFYRTFLPLQPTLAPNVWDGNTEKAVWSNDKFNAPELDVLDSIGIAAAWLSYYAPSLWRTTNAGRSWDSVPNFGPIGDRFGPVYAVNKAVWCVGDGSILRRSTDSGQSWTTTAIFPYQISDFGFFDSIGYLVLQGADYVEKSTDGGATWFAQSTGNTSMNFVIPTSAQSGYLNGGTSTIMHLNDGGVSGPVLSIRRLIDFGVLRPDSTQTLSVLARNVGSDTLRVTSYDVDNTFVTAITPGFFALAPGDSLRVTVSSKVTAHSFDSAHVHFHTNSLPRVQVVEVRAESNDSLSGVFAATIAEPLHLSLSKNPWTNASTLSILPTSANQSRIRICDLLGRTWLDQSSSLSAIILRASDLPSGFYVIEVDRKNSAPSRINMIHR